MRKHKMHTHRSKYQLAYRNTHTFSQSLDLVRKNRSCAVIPEPGLVYFFCLVGHVWKAKQKTLRYVGKCASTM